MNDRPKTVFEHIIELRSVLINSSFAILVAMIVCYIFINEIFVFLSKPLINSLRYCHQFHALVYSSISEIFSTHLRIAFYTSLFLCFPYILHQVWTFISPALTLQESSIIQRILATTVILFMLGAAFAFYVVIPYVFDFFIKSNAHHAEFLPKIGDNVSFIVILMFAFGLSFQMPILVIALDRLKILRIQTIQKLWREVILAIIVFAAIITPPDAFSMFFLAAPLIALFGISILVCRFVNRKS
ncbi:MAG: twin-arginine translocase subunit TatC [Holosporales bacterium]|nr:twin-arginine translocase subunit TatC [Holosporales bacterium]